MLEQLARAVRWIGASKRLAVLTGAGVSKESGIPTFRDALDGLWARYDPAELASPDAFARNPQLVWDWYAHRRETAEGCRPNPAHEALARLEDLLPQVVVITQNVDGFHQLAGSSDVIELHGNLHRYKCSRDCQGEHTPVPVSDYLQHTSAQGGSVPQCPNCGGLARPDIVWFGEMLPPAAIERAFAVAQGCDVMLVIGTSGMVQPAARLPQIARLQNAVVIDVNPEPNNLASVVDIFLQGRAGEIMPKIAAAILQGA